MTNGFRVPLATCFNTGSQCRATKWKGALSSFWVGRKQGLMCPIFQGMNYRQGSVRVSALCGCHMPSPPFPPCILNCNSQHPTQMTPAPPRVTQMNPEYATQMTYPEIQAVLSSYSLLWAADLIKLRSDFNKVRRRCRNVSHSVHSSDASAFPYSPFIVLLQYEALSIIMNCALLFKTSFSPIEARGIAFRLVGS